MKEDLENAIRILNKGGLILYPTDTIWGIGCDATNVEAVKKVYALKQRVDSKSMLVLLNNPNRLESYLDEVPDVAWELLDVADKPMTIIYDGAKNMANNLVADDGSIGIRIVNEPFCDGLLTRFKKPIVSTSANISGLNAPANFSEISEEIKKGVDYIVKYKQDELVENTPSSIIRLGAGGKVSIIRS